MGLFGKLFEKKECAICGGEIGLLGNRKLEDGNMCKACAAKLSPWFDERRHSTVAQIEEQLEYREFNKENIAAFRTTLSLGETAKVECQHLFRQFLDAQTCFPELNGGHVPERRVKSNGVVPMHVVVEL